MYLLVEVANLRVVMDKREAVLSFVSILGHVPEPPPLETFVEIICEFSSD